MEVQFKRIRCYFSRSFSNVASFVFPELKLKWLVRETKLNLPQELDFLREAANADKVRRIFVASGRFVQRNDLPPRVRPQRPAPRQYFGQAKCQHRAGGNCAVVKKTLPDELRIDYAKLWLALMKPDQDEILSVCERMNIGQNYGLFACIVTMRSWKSGRTL
ncbi:hypothetical protein niasHT_010252 [Heterodera trifolii]|uniref:ABC1 atypical kinase-like domain-containing protein n=1 Tax=Heterodera trifolii TaxID=157864 RepID=A0ABD2LRC0_9BILA